MSFEFIIERIAQHDYGCDHCIMFREIGHPEDFWPDHSTGAEELIDKLMDELAENQYHIYELSYEEAKAYLLSLGFIDVTEAYLAIVGAGQ